METINIRLAAFEGPLDLLYHLIEKNEIDIYDIKILLQNSPGIILIDDIERNYYPICSKADGNDEVFVGRIRRDFSVKNGINLWVVADNLRKGAATNAVQILEYLIKQLVY